MRCDDCIQNKEIVIANGKTRYGIWKPEKGLKLHIRTSSYGDYMVRCREHLNWNLIDKVLEKYKDFDWSGF